MLFNEDFTLILWPQLTCITSQKHYLQMTITLELGLHLTNFEGTQFGLQQFAHRPSKLMSLINTCQIQSFHLSSPKSLNIFQHQLYKVRDLSKYNKSVWLRSDLQITFRIIFPSWRITHVRIALLSYSVKSKKSSSLLRSRVSILFISNCQCLCWYTVFCRVYCALCCPDFLRGKIRMRVIDG